VHLVTLQGEQAYMSKRFIPQSHDAPAWLWCSLSKLPETNCTNDVCRHEGRAAGAIWA
jgi:hypothetical protein